MFDPTVEGEGLHVTDPDPAPAGMKSDIGTSRVSNGRHADPINRPNLSVAAAEHIRELIFDGSLRGGDRVPQDAVAEDLRVSRLPVREALITLQADGLVDTEPHRGAYVVPITREDIADHYAMYGSIQGMAAARAAARVDETVLARLERLIDEIGNNPDAPGTLKSHWEFHSIINHLGGSRRLMAVLRQMSHNLPRSIYEVPSPSSPASDASHRRIVAALRNGDANGVAEECIRHLVAEGALVIEELQRRGLFQ